jgi:hypothetical protein
MINESIEVQNECPNNETEVTVVNKQRRGRKKASESSFTVRISGQFRSPVEKLANQNCINLSSQVSILLSHALKTMGLKPEDGKFGDEA